MNMPSMMSAMAKAMFKKTEEPKGVVFTNDGGAVIPMPHSTAVTQAMVEKATSGDWGGSAVTAYSSFWDIPGGMTYMPEIPEPPKPPSAMITDNVQDNGKGTVYEHFDVQVQTSPTQYGGYAPSVWENKKCRHQFDGDDHYFAFSDLNPYTETKVPADIWDCITDRFGFLEKLYKLTEAKLKEPYAE